MLLGDLRTNRERVILPSSRKLRKNTLFIDQSAFSNFARYVITFITNTSHVNQIDIKMISKMAYSLNVILSME